MRYLILKDRVGGFKLVDNSKLQYDIQGNYVVNTESGAIKDIVNRYDDPIEAINDFVLLQIKQLRDELREEIKYGKY